MVSQFSFNMSLSSTLVQAGQNDVFLPVDFSVANACSKGILLSLQFNF
jgi:hypothetical protein